MPDACYLDVRDARQCCSGSATHGGRGQHGQQTYGHSGRRRLHVDPERYPRQDHDQYGRHVDLDQEESDISSEVELHLLTREVTYMMTDKHDDLIGYCNGQQGSIQMASQAAIGH